MRYQVLAICMIIVSTSQAYGVLVLNDLTSKFEDFDHLASAGTNIAWTNDQASESTTGSPGWYWQSDGTDQPYDADTGSSATGSPYSYGAASATDRAMGNLGGGDNNNTAWGVVFENASGVDIASLTVTYTGEQWRDGTSSNDGLSFAFRAASSEITDLAHTASLPAGWTAVANLAFTPPTNNTGPPAAIDGNDSANQGFLTETIAVSVPDGEFIALRWYDADSSGNDHGLAIDNLTVSFTQIPEPSAFAFGSLVCGIVGWTRSRRARREVLQA